VPSRVTVLPVVVSVADVEVARREKRERKVDVVGGVARMTERTVLNDRSTKGG